ncbi:hypothetical protein BWI17_17210 [Betaproteobacteria bacterium GR16-43]|nr:hypothetical protein BWI17_17210 [Betaproteobacteria bacterium GR16-43]
MRLVTPPEVVPRGSNWFDGLEMLRGLAAVSVMLFHCTGLMPVDATGTSISLMRAGWIGVDLFFVISGYVITDSALRQGGTAAYGANFWRARFARIVPLYYLTSVVFLLLVDPDPLFRDTAFQLATHGLFFHHMFESTAFSINGVTWSLGVEMQFYLVAFLLVPWLGRWSRGATIAAFVAALAGVLAWRWFAWRALQGGPDATLSHWLSQAPALFDSFALGALVRLFRIRGGGSGRAAAYATAAFILLVAIFLLYDTYAARYFQSAPMAVLFRTLVAMCGGLALLAALSAPPAASPAWRPFLYLGSISYGIYLWHLFALYTVQQLWPWQEWAAVPAVIGLTILLAGASHRWVEEPCMRWARRRRAA